uniref:Uncharacterized protein n=1 Tax=Oryza sativa subsp. japonica TaxID=39947 RepID=Q69X51_ORYSJ|nr:hypothetical protein [Oryza sativa Japonica Group]BAD32950.1 hypothetical protein [Oryza sativa Japonica Group]
MADEGHEGQRPIYSPLGSGCTFTLQCLSTPSPTVLVVLLLRLLGAALAMVSLLAERCAPLSL